MLREAQWLVVAESRAVGEIARPIPLEIMDAVLTAAARPAATEAGLPASASVAPEVARQYLQWMERRRFVRRSGAWLEVTREGAAFLVDLQAATRHLR